VFIWYHYSNQKCDYVYCNSNKIIEIKIACCSNTILFDLENLITKSKVKTNNKNNNQINQINQKHDCQALVILMKHSSMTSINISQTILKSNNQTHTKSQ